MNDFRTSPRRTNASPIAAARIAAGMTQAQLAARIGTTQGMIARWETGVRKPKMESLMRIGTALGIDWQTIIPR